MPSSAGMSASATETVHPVTRFLERAPVPVFSAYAIVAAFTTYFCMYAFRKPFTVATFEGGVELPGVGVLDYKIFLIIAQVIGYTLSKFIGIKVVSEMTGRRRGLAILLVIGFAELALVLFSITPRPYAAIFLFLNGLPLGMVWGLVFGFLEGRRISEALGAGLSASYIVASGAVKSVGKWLLDDFGVSEAAMPFMVGLIFFPLLALVVYLLKLLPPPSAEDEAVRVRREPMDGAQRRAFVKAFFPGLFFLTFLYMFLTAYRSIRDDFAREIWDALGYGSQPSIFAWTELPVAFGVLVGLALLMMVKDNRRAMMVVHGMMAAGTALIGFVTLGYQLGVVSPVAFMILVGFGAYLAYVPFGCVLFDRLIATVGFVATAGFMIYVTDAFGYLGSVSIMLYKNFGEANLDWLSFFVRFSYATSVICTVCFVASGVYFARHAKGAAHAA